MKKIVIIPGGFHPFHAGHMALYNAAQEAFPSAEVFVAATDDTSGRPFPFKTKRFLAQQAGVPGNRFIQVKSPFRAEEITQMYDPDSTVLIFARSEKDRMKQPQAGGVKKDGSASYLQPYKRNGLQPMSRHGYMVYLPTVQFGPGMTSATEIRAKWPTMDAKEKIALVKVLYPSTATNDSAAGKIVTMLDEIMGGDISEASGPQAGLHGTAIGGSAGGLQPSSTGMPNGADREPRVTRPGFAEATITNDPDSGMVIRPAGGMGTWTEKDLVADLSRKMTDMLAKLKARDYQAVHTMLYRDRWIASLVKALAELDALQIRQGGRPLPAGREIDTTDYVEEKSAP